MAKIRTVHAFALAGAVALAQTFGIAQTYAADADRWGGWVELGGALGGKDKDRAEAIVFLPMIQSDKALFFADVRGKLFEEQVSEVNAAIGYRHMLASGWNLGAWVGADRRDTSQDNIFWATSAGIEALSEDIDVRVNGYLAVPDPKGSPGLASAFIEGGQVFLLGGQEVPLSGFDGELGIRVPIEYLGANSARHGLRAYAGGFFFDDDDAFEKVTGPKARIEWRIDDVLAGIHASSLALETEWRSDRVRGGQLEAGLRFRLPFAIFSNTASRLSDRPVQWRRMTDGLERDTDIVTVRSEREGVEDLLTSVDFDRVVTVDATTGVTAPAATAGGNTLLVADGASGAIDGPQALQANQTLVGGSGSIQVRGLRSGTVATLTAPGQRPTFTNGVNAATVTMADRTHLASVNVTGNTVNLFNTGVLLASDQFVVLQNVDISNVGLEGVFGFDRNTVRLINVNTSNTPNGPAVVLRNDNTVSIEGGTFDNPVFGLFLNDRNTVNVAGVTISNPFFDGIAFNDGNALTVTDTTFTNVGFDAIAGNDSNVITVTNAALSTAGEEFIDVDDFNAVTVTGSAISGTGVDGIAFDSGNTLIVSDTTFTNIGFDAIFGNSNNVITLSDVTLSGAGEDFIDVLSSNTITVTNSMVSGAVGRSFLIDDDNVVTVTGGQFISTDEGFDADDRNTITLTDVSISSTGAQEGIDISEDNTFVMTGSTITVTGNRALEFTTGNNVTVNLSTLNGTPTNTVAYDGIGNVVSGSGNVDNTAPTVAFCSNAGAQTGTISFTNGTSCP
ncbi:MAG: right-handed parallel beta-helix repeat-containing protein [Candidatus Phaeomarinobacter sp.]